MGSSPAFAEIFAAEPGATVGVPFARFMELAMYHPAVGYYTAARRRVGRGRQADFFTATSFNPVFGELVVAAVRELLAGAPPSDFTFVEIGAEPEGGVLAGREHPFQAVRTISLGQPLEISGRCVIFSNELFDAQPFHRVVRRRGAWRELGVALGDGGALREVELPQLGEEMAALSDRLPADAPEGYHLDVPWRAVTLLERIITRPWHGLFLAFDYGKPWETLISGHPEGTGRTYSHQVMGHDLLDRPGRIDLTCHVCWDWLVDVLQLGGFGEAVVESQETFFTRHAGAALAAITAAEASRFSPRKQAVVQLLHPGHMGRKFQALHALRNS